MGKTTTRRNFLGTGVMAAGAIAVARHSHGQSASKEQSVSKEIVRFGIIGVGGRGTGLLTMLLRLRLEISR